MKAAIPEGLPRGTGAAGCGNTGFGSGRGVVGSMSEMKPVPRGGIGRVRKHMVVAADDGPPVSVFLNSNESAFGPSAVALAAATASAPMMHRYIEDQERLMVPALAGRYGLDPDRIAIGCGSDDLLVRLCRAYLEPGTELIRSANSYLKVPNYAHSNDATPVSAPDREFAPVPESMLAAVSERTRIVYLANPDNPSGSYIDVGTVRSLHGCLPGNILLVIDCAYFEYVEEDDPGGLLSLVENSGNVVVTRTFSKVHGLAGARVGWIYGPPDVVDAVNRLCYTFPLATQSVAAAIAALGDREHPEFVAGETKRLRKSFGEGFAGLGIKVYPSQANFLLLEFNDPVRTAAAACASLRRKGIAVRQFTAPSYGNCLRVTLGVGRELALARDALDEFMRTGR